MLLFVGSDMMVSMTFRRDANQLAPIRRYGAGTECVKVPDVPAVRGMTLFQWDRNFLTAQRN
jgi:hypothetical protein